MSTLKWRPSPALLVAALAISIALVGTAVAGPSAEISLNKNERRITVKIARQLSLKFIKRFTAPLSNRQITKREPGLSVANAANANSVDDDAITTAKIADDAVTADKADESIQKSDDLLSAIVANDGSLVRGRGATSSSLPATGDYRVTFDRDVDTCVPVVAPRLVGTPRFATVRADAPGTAANEVRVRIWDTAGAASSLQFNLLILC